MKNAKDCYNKGGEVKERKEKEHKKKEHEKLATGGEVKKHEKKEHKKAHEAHGEKSKPRVDKRARGGKMSPKSPLSGAEPSGLPGGGKGENAPDNHND